MPLSAALSATNTNQAITWPAAVAEDVTDSEGRFTIEVPSGNYLLRVKERRRYKRGNEVNYEWRMQITASTRADKLILTDANVHALTDPLNFDLPLKGTGEGRVF